MKSLHPTRCDHSDESPGDQSRLSHSLKAAFFLQGAVGPSSMPLGLRPDLWNAFARAVLCEHFNFSSAALVLCHRICTIVTVAHVRSTTASPRRHSYKRANMSPSRYHKRAVNIST